MNFPIPTMCFCFSFIWSASQIWQCSAGYSDIFTIKYLIPLITVTCVTCRWTKLKLLYTNPRFIIITMTNNKWTGYDINSVSSNILTYILHFIEHCDQDILFREKQFGHWPGHWSRFSRAEGEFGKIQKRKTWEKLGWYRHWTIRLGK